MRILPYPSPISKGGNRWNAGRVKAKPSFSYPIKAQRNLPFWGSRGGKGRSKDPDHLSEGLGELCGENCDTE